MSKADLPHFPTEILEKGYVTNGELLTDKLSEIPYPNDLVRSIRTKQEFAAIKSKNDTKVAVELDGSFVKIHHVEGLKTTLFEHQKTVVASMIDIEQRRIIRMNDTVNSRVMKIAWNVGVLSEPVGSGKTIEILALILSSPIPRAIADIAVAPMPKVGTETPIVRREWQNILRPTLIFVGGSVVKQWEIQIKTFTNLDVFVVDKVHKLRQLLKMIHDGTVDAYQVILVKNGTVTGNVKLPNGRPLSAKNSGHKPYIYNIISEMTNVCWSRVFIDDFDIINMPHQATVVPAIMTWLVSSTRKANPEMRLGVITNMSRASEILKFMQHPSPFIMANNFLFYMFNVRNSDDYRTSTMKLPSIKFTVCKFINPDDKLIHLLAGIGEEKINQITEMLNGDAIAAAAEVAGINTSSVADIFSKILGDKYTAFTFASHIVDFIQFIRYEDEQGQILPLNMHPDPANARYGKKQLLETIKPEYKYHGLNQLLDNTETEYKKIKEVNGLAVERVKSGIMAGNCGVCFCDLKTADNVTINSCCNAVLCGRCGMTAQSMANRYSKGQGICTNCREKITIKDIIFISNPGQALEKITNEEIDDAPIVSRRPKNTGPRNKYVGMMDIIRGAVLPEAVRVDMQLPNMMKGGHIVPEPKVRKVLVFASFDETLTKVKQTLDKELFNPEEPDTPSNHVHYWVLAGTPSEINETVIAFTKCEHACAMVINSTTHCAGLNLQSATDLVFMHTISDRAIESQVAGRGHRLGRKSQLNIWYMQFENEWEKLLQTHGCRIMTKDEVDYEEKCATSEAHNLISIENPTVSLNNANARYEFNAPDKQDDEDIEDE